MAKHVHEPFAMRSVTSQDGARIDYRELGEGLALVIMPGTAPSTSEESMPLARRLADRFRVCIVDRRGRFGSDPQGSNYRLDKEVEDLEAILDATGATRVFGHSAGAVIGLEAARRRRLDKLALYEPPHKLPDIAWLARFEQQLGKDPLSATITLVRGLGIAPEIDRVPDWLLKGLLRLRYVGAKRYRLAALLPSVPAEVRAINSYDPQDFAEIDTDVLLMSGQRSPQFLQNAFDHYVTLLPDCRVQRFPKLDHGGPNRAPNIVAEALRDFMS